MVAALCIGDAMAGPAHAHLHKKIHEKKDVNWSALPWNHMGIDWAAAYAAGQHTSTTVAPVPTTAAAVVPTTTAAAAPVATTASSSINNIVSDVENTVAGLWNDLVGVSNALTSFGASTAASGSTGDNYYGNVGSPYGSNVIKVSSSSGYQFTNTFVNKQSVSITVNVWQKVGPDGQALSGSALAPKDTTLTFVLAPGASQTVAFQDNTQVAFAQAVSSFTASGSFATTWGECNWSSAGGCGYDVSAIENANGNNFDMTISSKEVPDISAANPPTNMWMTATEPIGNSDGSVWIPGSIGSCTLTTTFAGTF